MANLAIGKPAPDFSLPAWQKNAQPQQFQFSLSACRGQKVVLAFYPADFTGVCTKEMCDFSDNLSSLKNLNALVVGISTDSIDKHKKFAEQYDLNFPLLADTDKKAGELYGVKVPLLPHRRAIFIIDEQGNLAWQKVELTALFRTEAKEIEKVIRELS